MQPTFNGLRIGGRQRTGRSMMVVVVVVVATIRLALAILASASRSTSATSATTTTRCRTRRHIVRIRQSIANDVIMTHDGQRGNVRRQLRRQVTKDFADAIPAYHLGKIVLVPCGWPGP